MPSNRKKLVVGNWKMNMARADALALVSQVQKLISASTKVETVICPPFVVMEAVKAKLEPIKIKLGAQNIHYLDHGPFTGEVSASMLRGWVDYVIVGHSERRLHFGETNDVIARKVAASVRNGITPILCVGENLFERQDDETKQVVQDQLAAGLVMLTTREVGKVVVAYEPVWAVDGDNIATPEQIKQAIKAIRGGIEHQFGASTAGQARILYGGHMEPDHAASYLLIKDLDGFLLGRASLNAIDFASVVKNMQRQPAKAASVKS